VTERRAHRRSGNSILLIDFFFHLPRIQQRPRGEERGSGGTRGQDSGQSEGGAETPRLTDLRIRGGGKEGRIVLRTIPRWLYFFFTPFFYLCSLYFFSSSFLPVPSSFLPHLLNTFTLSLLHILPLGCTIPILAFSTAHSRQLDCLNLVYTHHYRTLDAFATRQSSQPSWMLS